jgi:RNA polymerase sigma-70 factor (ECF subfamily)
MDHGLRVAAQLPAPGEAGPPGADRAAEALLVERVRGGDGDAFEELVARYQGPLFGYLLSFVGEREAAQDLLQETFLRAYRSIGELADTGTLRGWLYRIAHNQACSLLRRRRLLRWLPLSLGRDALPGPERAALASARVRETLAQIPPDQRAPLLLHLVAGFSYAEIAALLRLSEGAVRMRISRGRALFRAAYGEEDDDAP